MKKTALALSLTAALGLGATSAYAVGVTSLNVTYGDFGMNMPPDGAGGVNDWSGTLDMHTSGVLIPNAFNFNGSYGPVDIGADSPGLSGDDAGGVNGLTLNLDNFAIDWNGNHIGQGPDAGTLDVASNGGGLFAADWTALIVGGSFDGNTGYWHMEGSYTTAVPVPAAVWLFGSGLMGLVGIARRRTKTA